MSQKVDPQAMIKQLIESLDSLEYLDENATDALHRRVKMIIQNVFGTDSKYLEDLSRITFYPMMAPASEEYKKSSWLTGCASLSNLLQTMSEELTLFGGTISKPKPNQDADSKSVFVVHGHDEAMKVSVARTLENLDLEPIILHEKPNQGRTIIEKFRDYSAVGFAVVLLSPDDFGKLKTAPLEELRPRARQNVIFELGFFIGRLGIERVVALYKAEDNFEFPSDYSGVLFVPYDLAGRWQIDLVKELKASGYEVDANKLIKGN